MDTIQYRRRESIPVRVGTTTIGGGVPIVIQSMTNVDTNQIREGVEQSLSLAKIGCQMIRFTTQGLREVSSLESIHALLRRKGCNVPLVADVHFNPKVAYAAAEVVEKVRINPGNFYDPARKFKTIEYSTIEYEQEVRHLQSKFEDFLTHCRRHDTAIRIGVNHGSLSDRIMSRYGDTPAGMVESCMEFLRVCRRIDFDRVVISIKASNPLIMTETVRLLCTQMQREDMHYPLHLGVTEAGEGEDGRIKSAVGIGSLLADGIGDTIRVSLSESPLAEIPVAQLILESVRRIAQAPCLPCPHGTEVVSPSLFEGYAHPIVIGLASGDYSRLTAELRPDFSVHAHEEVWCISDVEILSHDHPALLSPDPDKLCVIDLTHPYASAAIDRISRVFPYPFVARLSLDVSADVLAVEAGVRLGRALLSGQCAGIWLRSSCASETELVELSFRLLQATRRRITRTEYISCPGCGRTLFGLEDTVAKIKAATQHLKGLKIGVMGCIVNGPGEMADADYGYVGGSRGKIDLYKGKVCVSRGIPQQEALPCLIELIKENGDWQDP